MKRAIALFTFFGLALAAWTLEVEEGRIRLTLDENSSRFLLAIRSSESADQWIPLLFPEDPRTSSLDIRAGNRIIRVGDTGEFRQVAEQTDEGIFFIWTSPTLRIAERFRFIRSVGGRSVDGVQLDIAVTNLGEQTTTVGARLVLDTYLGERDNAHFSTPLQPSITRETSITPSAVESYIRSGAAKGTDGLQVMLFGNGVTTPTQVAVANWKRLSDSAWDYAVNQDRNFNRLPYSINDSALLLGYQDRVLGQNDRYVITLRLGGYAPDGFRDPESSVPVSADERQALLSDLAGLIDEIDALLASPDASAQEVADLKARLEALSEQIPGP